MNIPESTSRYRIGGLVLLALTIIVAIGSLLEIAFVIPIFDNMFRDYGADLPKLTTFMIALSHMLTAFHYVGFVVLLTLALCTIVLLYLVDNRRQVPKPLYPRLALSLVAFILLIGFVTMTMYLPISKMGTIVGGTVSEFNQTSEGIDASTSIPSMSATTKFYLTSQILLSKKQLVFIK